MSAYLPGRGAHSSDGEFRSRFWEERANADAIKHISRDLASPDEYGIWLCMQFPELVAALTGARLVNHNAWQLTDRESARQLRMLGLVACGQRSPDNLYLTAYGIKVRKALLETEQ